ncbi:MAG: hypothetical protein H8F28_05025, partial [Fibrella sp.]|nr:hypothetical protein [Armatimonadota bacterium]
MNYSKILRNAIFLFLTSVVVAYAVALSLPVTVIVPVRPPEPAENAFLPLTAAASRILDYEKITDARLIQPGKKQWTLAEKRVLVEKNRDIVAFAHQAIQLPYRET